MSSPELGSSMEARNSRSSRSFRPRQQYHRAVYRPIDTNLHARVE